jgi:Protein of unknown function (DUF982)
LKRAAIRTISSVGRRSGRLPGYSQKEKEEVLNDVPFSEPITLKLQSVGERKVASSWEAIECMQQWPDRARGRSWRAAYRACRDALDGWRTAGEARTAFVKAARTAGLLVTGREST